jgi:hypothetical protein
MPPAFNLSQDQTLQFKSRRPPKRPTHSLLDKLFVTEVLVDVSWNRPNDTGAPAQII